MDEPQDSEVTLGTGKLLAIFFGLVIVCGIFFALGYSFGRASAPIPMQEPSTTSAAVTGGPKPAPLHGQPPATSTSAEANPCEGANCNTDDELNVAKKTDQTPPAPAKNTDKPAPELTNSGKGYIVQVAAVTKQEDADALVSALRTKKYPVFLVSSTATDKYFHVQVGPFGTQQEAESMRAQLVKDGYDAMLKK